MQVTKVLAHQGTHALSFNVQVVEVDKESDNESIYLAQLSAQRSPSTPAETMPPA